MRDVRRGRLRTDAQHQAHTLKITTPHDTNEFMQSIAERHRLPLQAVREPVCPARKSVLQFGHVLPQPTHAGTNSSAIRHRCSHGQQRMHELEAL